MAEPMTAGAEQAAQSVAYEAFGVRVGVTADPANLLGPVARLLPPGARRCVPATVKASFGIHAAADGTYRFTREGATAGEGFDLGPALGLLESELRMAVGVHAPGRIFIHAGVVAHEGRAIVIPGLSMAGKTSLVIALIRAGAVYYSDEFAVLDERGYVHPYAEPLWIRDGDMMQYDRSPESLGAVVGENALRIGAVIFTRYRPGADWNPTHLSPGRAALAMLQNTLAAMKRSDEAMRVIRRAIRGAVLLDGERGEATAIAERLLECVSASGRP